MTSVPLLHIRVLLTALVVSSTRHDEARPHVTETASIILILCPEQFVTLRLQQQGLLQLHVQ